MRMLSGLILMLAGAGVMLYGIWLALRQLVGLYQGAMSDPLGQPEGTEAAAQQGMIEGVKIGAVGVVPFLIGVYLFRGAVARRLRRRAQRRAR
ncbi:MAG TPA: hypothetical protein VFF69_03095 [Phycisphaerales bacterium]|nr:hypothetical protein [Phycisphaerales bacterium]